MRLHKQVPFIGCLGRERHWNGPPSLPASAQDINVFPPKRAWNNQKGYFILDNHMAANHVLTTIWPKTWFPLIPLIKCCLSSGVKVCALKTTAWLYPSGYCSKQIIYNKNFGPKCVFKHIYLQHTATMDQWKRKCLLSGTIIVAAEAFAELLNQNIKH